ncbi:MAG: cytochrome c-type biogenesis protein CcmH [Nitrospinae bacterium]|nr:cytochrome c-type biogenesis protein CcmH [Nitrospinota bacterium]
MRILLLTFVFIFTLQASSQALTLKEIEGAVMCMCPDNCGKVLINCSCKYSDEYRHTFAEQIKQGMNKKAILQSWINKYGEKGLSAPIKEGFNLTAWIVPFLALFLAGGLVFTLIRKWNKKALNNSESMTEPEQKNLSKEDQDILKKIKNDLNDLDT